MAKIATIICFVFVLFTFQIYCQSSSPVFVTPYLPGNYAAAQNATRVTLEGYNYPSYSGYFTVNETYNSNTFFWFFPAHFNPEGAPVLVWLQGGPGSSSMFGLFNENGPFFVSTKNFPELVANNYTWVRNFSMVYIDNPVGTGFSFTDDKRGYSTNEDEIGTNLYNAIVQFFQLFPELKENDFYVTGESYAGKYVPSAAYKIYNMNQDSSNQYVNLKGISIGDGMMDPLIQTQGYADLMYQMSLMDENEVVQGYIYENLIENYILSQNYTAAFFVFDEYLNADFYPYDSYYFNVTGLTSYYNFLTPTYPSNPYIEFLDLPATKEAIHVGTNPYHDYNSTCEEYLIPDWMKSIAYKLTPLLDNYKVMIYNGQNDVILSGPVCENFLRTVQWDGRNDYLSAEKIIWKVEETDQQVAGYVRQALNFRQVLVRDAGHILPADQPRAAFDMIYRFINDISFSSDSNY